MSVTTPTSLEVSECLGHNEKGPLAMEVTEYKKDIQSENSIQKKREQKKQNNCKKKYSTEKTHNSARKIL
jgi:hypothetical protein